MRVTQRQVAAAAGVSLSAVSLVFSGSRKISSATAARVREVAARLGYRPTPGLSAAQSARWRDRSAAGYSRLAMIETAEASQRHYLRAVMTGSDRLFARQAREMGYDLEVVQTDGVSAQKLRERLSFLRVDGIIFPMVTRIPTEVEAILGEWPCVGMFTQTRSAGFPVVSPDELMGSHRVLDELVRHGSRRPLLILQSFAATRGVISRLGGLLAARAANPDVEPLPVCWIEPGQPQQAVERLKVRDYEALIVESSEILFALEKILPDLTGMRRAVLQLSDEDRAHAGIRNDPELLHAQVLRLIDTMVRGNITGAQLSNLRQTVAFPWQPGASLA